jgi:hypothetical protein
LLGGGLGAVQTAVAQDQQQRPRPPAPIPSAAPAAPSAPTPSSVMRPAVPSVPAVPAATGTARPASVPTRLGTTDQGAGLAAQLGQLIPVLTTLAQQIGAAQQAGAANASPATPVAQANVGAASTAPAAPTVSTAPAGAEGVGDQGTVLDEAVGDRDDGRRLVADEAVLDEAPGEAAGPWLSIQSRAVGEDGGRTWAMPS